MDEHLHKDGKLGHGFTSADELQERDLGDGSKPRPTFISARLDLECKVKLIKLLKADQDFVWGEEAVAVADK